MPTLQKAKLFLDVENSPGSALITAANVQISDVQNSHLINCRSFCAGQKAILHAAVSDNSQAPTGGSGQYQFGIS